MKDYSMNFVRKNELTVLFTTATFTDLAVRSTLDDMYYKRLLNETEYNTIVIINGVVVDSSGGKLHQKEYYDNLSFIADTYWSNSIIILSNDDAVIRKDILDNYFIDVSAVANSEDPIYMFHKPTDQNCIDICIKAKAFETMEFLCAEEDPESDEVAKFIKYMVNWHEEPEDKDRAIEHIIEVLQKMNIEEDDENA